ncbi:MAG: tRNA 2-thiocytidine(32) synthetase TtcA [Cycloclasticus sp.]|nr:tRNA 2-thiocytidine(32) synthetase TtcA [Cycloclasticus sp.]
MDSNEKTKVRFNKLQKRLRGEMGRAIADYNMIEDGGRIMVCLSGGKDSYTMLDILLSLKKSAPIHFDILAVNLDQKQPGFPEHILPEYLEAMGVEYHVIEQDTYSVVKQIIPEGKTTCGLCSRMRRGALYAYAEDNGYNKIALGHHRDDIIETFFLNMFHGGQLKAMPAKLKSDNGKHIVIRPLAYAREKDIAEFASIKEYPIIPCNLCGSQENLQRVQMKKMLSQWDKEFPGRVETIFNSLKNIKPSQLLDSKLFDFNSLTQTQSVDPVMRGATQPVTFPIMQASK